MIHTLRQLASGHPVWAALLFVVEEGDKDFSLELEQRFHERLAELGEFNDRRRVAFAQALISMLPPDVADDPRYRRIEDTFLEGLCGILETSL